MTTGKSRSIADAGEGLQMWHAPYGVEVVPETGHDDIGETGESAKKRYTNDFGLYLSYMYDERLQGVCNNNIV